MAPEYFDKGTIDYPMDVYSFAMTTWQIYTGLFPLADIQIGLKDRIVTNQERPEYPDSMFPELWDVIEKCWRHNPEERPTFLDVEAFLKPCVIHLSASFLVLTNNHRWKGEETPEPDSERDVSTSPA